MIDTRGKLEEGVFDYHSSKDGKVFLLWHGKTVKTLTGKQAERFLAAVSSADEHGAQLLMARVTGNFKHGNERSAKKG